MTDYQNADYSERERLIGAGVTDVDTQDTSLRPVALSEFIGQQQLRDNLKVFVDAAAVMYLLGTDMDYKKEEFSSSFVFNNPNESERCGCGESFKI